MTRATEQDIVQALSIANAAVLQAERERDHWRRAAGLLKLELRCVLGVWMKRSKKTRIQITDKEFNELDRNKKLYVGNPDPGVRRYEMREGQEQMIPESKFISEGGAGNAGIQS